MMTELEEKIKSILKRYEGAYVSCSGKRTIEKQIFYVKTRPTEYKKTLSKYFKEHNIDKSKMNDDIYLATIYDGKEQWLREAILYYAKRNEGYQHLSGNAIDVVVAGLDISMKKKLHAELQKNGYHIILEYVKGKTAKYNVSMSISNVFHIDLLKH